MFHHVLRDRLDERVVAHGLDENCSVVVARRRCHIYLDCQPEVLLQQAVVNVLNALKPCHSRVVDVVRLVIEHREFFDLAHDLAQVDVAVGGLADRLWPEWREEIVAQIIILKRWVRHVAEIDAVDIGQEEVAGRAYDAHVVLDV